MSEQQMVPQTQNPTRIWTSLLQSIVHILAVLWRFLVWIWSILIVGALVGFLGNTGYTYATTGSVNFKDPRTLAIVTWFNTHIVLNTLSLALILMITLCSFLAHLWHQRAAQEHLRQHEESLVILARGVQRTLDELSPKSITSSSQPSPVEGINQEILPQTIWNVPYRRNPFFTGREQLLNQLHAHLTTSKATALTQAQAINGLGGIGKTQTAIEYAYRHRKDYHYIFWVNADTRERLIADYVDVAKLLQLPGHNEQDQTLVVTAVKRWLATHNTCLLILDNADDLTIIDPFLPDEYTCHILLTTREQTTGIMAHPIEVEKMNIEEGTLMLLRRAKVLASDAFLEQANQKERKIAETIVLTLGGLPLALDQAGAYIEENACPFTAYLQAYTHRQTDLLNYRGKQSIYHADPVATTWSLSFEQVEQHNPLAADLMRCCAFLAPDDIPEEFFIAGASELSPLLQPIEHDSSLLDEAIGELRRFSLVRRNHDTTSFSIHRLVQAILRTTMDETTQLAWAERTVRMVNQVFPKEINVTTWKQCQRYIAHAQTCATSIAHYHLAFPEAANGLVKTADYLQDLVLYTEAEPLYQRSLRM